MTEERRIQNPIDGSIWGVSAGGFTSADVIVPTCRIAGMTDEEIGRAVRTMAREADLLYARFRADYLYDAYYQFVALSTPWKIPPEVLQYKTLLENAANDGRMNSYESRGGALDWTDYELIEIVLEMITVYETYQSYKATKTNSRNEIARNYDKLFVKIGRRDSFKCKHCGSSDDLAIDHIHALANGGTNELDNLQLLCRACNSSKGAR